MHQDVELPVQTTYTLKITLLLFQSRQIPINNGHREEAAFALRNED
jgi:hypothetical protein